MAVSRGRRVAPMPAMRVRAGGPVIIRPALSSTVVATATVSVWIVVRSGGVVCLLRICVARRALGIVRMALGVIHLRLGRQLLVGMRVRLGAGAVTARGGGGDVVGRHGYVGCGIGGRERDSCMDAGSGIGVCNDGRRVVHDRISLRLVVRGLRKVGRHEGEFIR